MKLASKALMLLVCFFLGLSGKPAEGTPLRPEKERNEFQTFIHYSNDYYKDICLFGQNSCSRFGLQKPGCYLDELFPCTTSYVLKLPQELSALSFLENSPTTKEELLSWLAIELSSTDTQQRTCSTQDSNFQRSG